MRCLRSEPCAMIASPSASQAACERPARLGSAFDRPITPNPTVGEGERMASVTERLERTLEREAPVWGVDPVPPEHRHLSGFDVAVLWGDLSVGLLVLLTGALLVPALSLPHALLAILIGTALGCIPLALVGLAGAREGVPGMVLFRPVLGLRGSYVPSVLNILQLAGWTGFELWAMSQVAAHISQRLFGS